MSWPISVTISPVVPSHTACNELLTFPSEIALNSLTYLPVSWPRYNFHPTRDTRVTRAAKHPYVTRNALHSYPTYHENNANLCSSVYCLLVKIPTNIASLCTDLYKYWMTWMELSSRCLHKLYCDVMWRCKNVTQRQIEVRYNTDERVTSYNSKWIW